jgi:glutamine amidotransferase
MTSIGIVDCAISNVGSVRNAFQFLGFETRLVRAPGDVRNCSHVVLPGDGSFPFGMKRLRETGLDKEIEVAAHGGKPILGICLGMQLLAEEGEEIELTRGLGLTCGRVERMAPDDARYPIPHVGWNDVMFYRQSPIVAGLGENAAFYFMQSYAYADSSASAVAGVFDYGGPVVAVIEQGNIFGVQFHPEKSQRAGLQILKNFAELT